MTKERDEFMAIMGREMPGERCIVTFCRKLMRYSKTHARLQEALCNGDWPADNGERPTVACSRCEMGYAPETVSKKTGLCRDCRLEDTIREECKPYGIEPIFSGDPRGCTVKLKLPTGATNDWAKEGVCVPQ